MLLFLAGEPMQKALIAKRDRGCPPTTQDYVGLARAKKAAARAEEGLNREPQSIG